MVDDGGKIVVDAGEAVGGLHARGGVDAPVGQGAKAVPIVVQYPPAHNGEAGINAQNDHVSIPFPQFISLLYHKNPRKSNALRGFSEKSWFFSVFDP
jgi:hypothetical protein